MFFRFRHSTTDNAISNNSGRRTVSSPIRSVLRRRKSGWLKTTLLATAGVLICVCCAESHPDGECLATLDTKALLRRLDRTLAEKQIYQQQYNERLDSIRRIAHNEPNSRKRLRATRRLVSLYAKHNVDTAFIYAYMTERMAVSQGDSAALCAARISIARLHIASNMLTDAANDLKLVREKWFKWAHKDDYYGACRLMFDHKAVYEIRDSLTSLYRKISQAYRDSVIAAVSPKRMTYKLEMSRVLRLQGRQQEALLLTKPVFEKETASSRIAPIAHEIANTYREIPNSTDSAMRYLAITAISDLRIPVRDGVAIRQLADLLLEKGDLSQANRCINSVVEDAVMSNALERIQSATGLSKAISNAYILRIKDQKRHLNYMVSALVLLALLLMLMFWQQIKKNRKIENLTDSLRNANDELSGINEQLNTKNIQLSELSDIKDGYICGYMNLCTSYISMLEEYRQEAYRTANKGGLGKIIEFLRSPLVAEHEYKKFYRHFDATFLSMFPDFVEQVNMLLQPESRFSVAEGTLTTELRILAALRLGITNSVQIAEFLHCSKSTIFNYRTRLRNAALGNRSDFECRVMSVTIGHSSRPKPKT